MGDVNKRDVLRRWSTASMTGWQKQKPDSVSARTQACNQTQWTNSHATLQLKRGRKIWNLKVSEKHVLCEQSFVCLSFIMHICTVCHFKRAVKIYQGKREYTNLAIVLATLIWNPLLKLELIPDFRMWRSVHVHVRAFLNTFRISLNQYLYQTTVDLHRRTCQRACS